VSELVAEFLGALGEPARPEDEVAIGIAIDDALAAGPSAWPGVAVDPGAWVRALAGLAPKPLDPARPLGALAAVDHYLAFACGAGDPAALAACDALLVREATIAADAARLSATIRDEAVQIVRTQLFVARAERPAAIHDYAGRGPLRGWLRVTVSRELVRVAKAQQRSVSLEEHLLADSHLEDPLLAELKVRGRQELADGFRASLAELAPRDRTLLRYQLVDGLTIDDIGAIYRVHRATAARWLARIRDELVEKTRARVAAALGVDTDEAASIVRLVQSQLDVSVIRHLGPTGHDPGA
jgi:RNA polymerase sigma-70 factor (ECF subfamily)